MLRVPNNHQQNSKKTIVIDITNYKIRKLPNRSKDEINRFQLKYTNSNRFPLKYTNNWLSLREKCRNTAFCLFRIQENTDQKKIHIWTLFTQCTLDYSAAKTNNFSFVKSSNVLSNVSTKPLTIIFFFQEFYCRNPSC